MACGVSAIALSTNAPNVLRDEALDDPLARRARFDRLTAKTADEIRTLDDFEIHGDNVPR